MNIAPDKWLSEFLKSQLEENVPEEIMRLFEVARGAAIYGYFFYPQYALAIGQLFRVAESALILSAMNKEKIRIEFLLKIKLTYWLIIMYWMIMGNYGGIESAA